MLNNPPDNEASQTRRLQGWWLELPLSYRVNALLYLGGGLLAVFLLVTLLAGGDSKPRQIQVGAGANGPTTTAAVRPNPVPAPTVGVSTSSSSSTTGPTTSTTRPVLQFSGPASAASSGGGTASGGSGGSSSGGGGSGGGAAEETTSTTDAPATTTSSISITPCRNSQESRCGDFSWDPAPAQNQPLNVTVNVKTPNPKVGQPVLFEVTVIDPDHAVGLYCSRVSFGDGATADDPCTPPPPGCPPHYGPWTPPNRENGTFTHQYTHTYQGATTFRATFMFRSWSADRCLELDPYANENDASKDVVVTLL
ncbi:MAG: hypothetical protein ACRD12_04340 [Acidimicrobiales bacterium]